MARNFATHATKNFKRWSQSEDSKLKRMVREGFNSEQIALEMGRTRASISVRKSTIGIKERITPARGSSMPYTASEKHSHGTFVTNAVEVKEKLTKPATRTSLGESLDDFIGKAKAMGLKVNITLASEE
jgi:hypothetical protein